MFPIVVVGVWVMLGAVGCQQEFRASELAGEWHLRSESRSRLPAAARRAAIALTLKADGTFVSTELPKVMVWDYSESSWVTGTGVWRLDVRDGRQELLLELRHATTGPKDHLPFGARVSLSRSGADPVLYFFEGDPDAGRRFELTKQG